MGVSTERKSRTEKGEVGEERRVRSEGIRLTDEGEARGRGGKRATLREGEFGDEEGDIEGGRGWGGKVEGGWERAKTSEVEGKLRSAGGLEIGEE